MRNVTRRELVILAVILAGFSVVVVPRLTVHRGAPESHKVGGAYFCPMHPSYTSDRPGDCPICNMKLVLRPEAKAKGPRRILYYRHPMGQPDTSPVPKKDAMGMDYVPVYEDEVVGRTASIPEHAMVEIPLARQQLIGVKLGTVGKRAFKTELRTVGRVAFDAELYTAQQEFLSALEDAERAKKTPYPELAQRSRALADSVRTRLTLLGMSEEEIAELEKSAQQDRSLILPAGAPGRTVWVYGTIYEYELPFVKVGTEVTVRVPTLGELEFKGQVRALDPVLDPGTRSVRVRAVVADPTARLRPEMYVDVYFRTDVGEVVAVPEEAVLYSGERAIVFVAKGEGFFEPREVKLGAKLEHALEVRSGLEGGERVAVSGNFLIDSESRLQAALSSFAEVKS